MDTAPVPPLQHLVDGICAFLGALDQPDFDALIASSRPPADTTTAAPPADDAETLDPKALAAKISR